MVRIHFFDLQIGSVSNSSGVFQGSTKQWNFKHVSKDNQAFGTVNGRKVFVSDFRSSLDDIDQIDSYSKISRPKM